MAQTPDEYFGAPPQQILERRAHDLWRIVRNDPRFSSHGRAVGLTDPDSGAVELQAALARLQGVCPLDGIETDRSAAWISALEALGLKTDVYVSWRGAGDSLSAAKALLAQRSLPDDLTVQTINPHTSSEVLSKLDTLTTSCEVLLPMGAFLRGIERPSVVIAAFDRQGRAVGAAATIAQNHPDHMKAGLAYWGMLATALHRRGEGIALVLGAMALTEMRSHYGFEHFATGVRAGNEPSEALCARLEFRPSDYLDIMAIHPPAFADGRMTK